MTHLTMEQLLAVREPGLEPGVRGWKDHIEACELCRSELERIDQRVARLRALPTLLPARNRFLEIRARTQAERRIRRFKTVSLLGLSLAASVAFAVVLAPRLRSAPAAAELSEQQELNDIIARSRQMENALDDYNPDQRVTDGRTATVAASLEDRLARVDDQLQLVPMMDQNVRREQALRLWKERVGLLGMLMDVHISRASSVRY